MHWHLHLHGNTRHLRLVLIHSFTVLTEVTGQEVNVVVCASFYIVGCLNHFYVRIFSKQKNSNTLKHVIKPYWVKNLIKILVLTTKIMTIFSIHQTSSLFLQNYSDILGYQHWCDILLCLAYREIVYWENYWFMSLILAIWSHIAQLN